MFRVLIISLLVFSSLLINSVNAASTSSIPLSGCGSSGLYANRASAVCSPTTTLTSGNSKTVQAAIDSSAALAAGSTKIIK